MLPIEELKKIIASDSFLFISGKDFLKRQTISFDNDIPVVIYDIDDIGGVEKKIKKIFGNADIVNFQEYMVIKSKKFIERDVYSFGDLVEIIWRLRDPDGCPWDRAQTNMTIRNNAIEEAYELVEAIELNDMDKILEESGDVILQGLFNAVIAEEDGRFSTQEVISALCKKLVTRHTHIFGKNKATNSDEALKFWEQAKAIEKGQKSVSDKLASVPVTFSALMKANKVQKIIKKTGFEFPSIEEAEKKILEELQELREAKGEEIEKEGGDLLFSVVNTLRMRGIDPELALNGTTSRFIHRFCYVEEQARLAGKKPEECTLEEMESWYKDSKKYENK